MIEINNLKKSFEKKPVLKNIDLKIDTNGVFGLIGPNGAGKTTLLRSIIGLEEHQEGKIKINNKNIQETDRKELAKKIAYVPQETKINFDFTVKEIVKMGRLSYGTLINKSTELNKVKESMKKVGIYELRNRLATTLSGGELQKTIIARALAQDTDIILFDEPTQHLDIGNRIEIMELIKDISKNKQILAVFHDLNLASMYCKNLALLSKGKIISKGKPSEVLLPKKIKEAYGKNVVLARNPVDNSIYVVPEKDPVSEKTKQKKIHVICGGGTGSNLLSKLKNRGYQTTTGVLNVLDSDKEVADKLNIPAVAEAPFSKITKETHKRNKEMIKKSNKVILTPFPVSEGNLLNLKAAKYALDKNKELIYIKPNENNQKTHLTKEAKKIFNELKQKGLIIAKNEEEAINKLK